MANWQKKFINEQLNDLMRNQFELIRGGIRSEQKQKRALFTQIGESSTGYTPTLRQQVSRKILAEKELETQIANDTSDIKFNDTTVVDVEEIR